MKLYISFALFLLTAMSLSSCKSLVTFEDVSKQENTARKAVEKAQEETVDLARMKEQYTIDRAKAEIKALEKEQKAADKDIKSLKGIQTESAVGTTEGTLNNLEKQSKAIDKKIKDLKQESPENWDETIQQIRQDFESIYSKISQITANLNKK